MNRADGMLDLNILYSWLNPFIVSDHQILMLARLLLYRCMPIPEPSLIGMVAWLNKISRLFELMVTNKKNFSYIDIAKRTNTAEYILDSSTTAVDCRFMSLRSTTINQEW